jgi:Restriction endonuclease
LLEIPGYCAEHQRLNRKQYDDRRGSAASRGYGSRWQRARAVFLSQHPLCEECAREGALTPATVVDHIQPHRGNQEMFWGVTNWQSLCKRHHDIKTVKEDGGFGNQRKDGV